MAKDKKPPHSEFLTAYVRELQQLNDIEIEVLQAPIEEVIKDPQGYAQEYAEMMFTRHLTRYFLAYNLGKDFAKKNKTVESAINGKEI